MKLAGQLILPLALVLLTGCVGGWKSSGGDSELSAGEAVDHPLAEEGRHAAAVLGSLSEQEVAPYLSDLAAELNLALSETAKAGEGAAQTTSDNSLLLRIASESTFDVNSSTLRSSAERTYERLAQVLKAYPKTIVHVVGHTDNSGREEYNMALAQRRADGVAGFFVGQGLDGLRLRTEGRGPAEPIADNATARGRRENRRVDIVIRPIVEGREYEAIQPPPYLGK
ncbi:MAG: OmpA family protein [Pseudomonadota bacterium]|nr:OmpA family protein [Pseudomonadota bacterium]